MHSIVIVDDNIASAEMLATTIDWQSIDCQVTGVAYEGTKGEALIVAQQPDIILSDIHMPDMDGLRMIELAKRFSPHSQVIFISAYDDFHYAQKALTLHASSYLLKPFRNSELIAAVKTALSELKAPPMAPAVPADAPPIPADANVTLQVECILQYIQSHMSNSLSLNELSRQFALSPSYISTLIKQQTGMNYSTWLTQARIRLAKQLLRKPDHRVGEIALLVGYKSYIAFYRIFSGEVGMTPTDYRNKRQPEGKNDEA